MPSAKSGILPGSRRWDPDKEEGKTFHVLQVFYSSRCFCINNPQGAWWEPRGEKRHSDVYTWVGGGWVGQGDWSQGGGGLVGEVVSAECGVPLNCPMLFPPLNQNLDGFAQTHTVSIFSWSHQTVASECSVGSAPQPGSVSTASHLIPGLSGFHQNSGVRTSLGVQWLRIHLLMQGT